jgi:chorismate mutase/prephenate dehydratase
MSGSFALEKPLRIGYLGPPGSFRMRAASRQFGNSVDYVPLADIQSVFAEVARSHIDYGLVPVENSLQGGIMENAGRVPHFVVRRGSAPKC